MLKILKELECWRNKITPKGLLKHQRELNMPKSENITYKILNKSIGHFHVFDEFGNLFQFWASTGKITYAKNTKDARGFKSFTDERGIENCIKIVKYRNLKCQNSKTKEICDKIRKFANEYRVSILTDEYVNYYDLLELLNDIEKENKELKEKS